MSHLGGGSGVGAVAVALCLCAAVVVWPRTRIGSPLRGFGRVTERAGPGSDERPAVDRRRGAAITAGVTIAVGSVLWASVSWALGVAAGAIVGTAIGLVRRARAAARRSRALDDVIVELRSLCRQWGAGHEVTESVRRATDRAVGHGQHLVAPVLHGLLSIAEHDADAASGGAGGGGAGGGDVLADVHRRLGHARQVSARHGVPLSPLVAAIADDLADRRDVDRERATQAAGPALSGYVVAALPLAGLALGAGMGVNPVAVLCGTTVGHALLVAGAVLLCAGLWWSERIVGR